MPLHLSRSLRTATAALLSTLAACGPTPMPNNTAVAPATEDRPSDVAPDAPPPRPYAPSQMAPVPDSGQSGPRDRFIVCPGNPRCPPADRSQPKGGQD